MSIYRLAIIGAGQIGLRHLQSLNLLEQDISLEILDPSEQSLKAAKELVNRFTNRRVKKVAFYQDISSLDDSLDLVIVATNSKVRFQVLQELISKKQVRYLIVEKILFQEPNHFAEINELLNRKNIRAWVNCPLRTIGFYQDLQGLLANSQSLQYYVSYANIDLGSNAIHHLDLFVFLTGEIDLTIDSALLDDRIIPSKRAGFSEFTGTLTGSTKRGDKIVLTSYPAGNAPPFVMISSERMRCVILPKEQRAWLYTENSGWHWEEKAYIHPYQSQQTNLAIEEILTTGNSRLTSYFQSWQIHLPLLRAFMRHIEKVTKEEVRKCPIT